MQPSNDSFVSSSPLSQRTINAVINFVKQDKFKSVEEASGYPAAWFFVFACLVLTGVLTLVGGAKLLVDLVGFVYPAYMSFKSMDTNAGDDTQWLTYWIVFSFLSIIETMLSFVTALIPMYFWLKIAIIIVSYGSSFVFCFSLNDTSHTNCSSSFLPTAVDVVSEHTWCTNDL
jgi:hypothetical protein